MLSCIRWAVMVLLTANVMVNASDSITVSRLRCEYLVNPLGVDVAEPRLSWVIESEGRGVRQEAYQILAAGSPDKLNNDIGDLWDTGKVESDKSVHVVYAGKSLPSGMRVYWKVRIWCNNRGASGYSRPAWWEMGLLKPGDFKGRWISAVHKQGGFPGRDEPAPYFRKLFTLSKPLKRARVYVCGLGYYELYLNGRKVGDHVLDPAFTRYDRRALYVTYDITDRLKEGGNVVGVILGNGWFNLDKRASRRFYKARWRGWPVLWLQIEVEYADGNIETLISDGTWKVSKSPVIFNVMHNGETYDARLEKRGCFAAGYDDSGWDAAQVCQGPGGKLRSQMLPPIKVTETISPVKLTEPSGGVYVYDMGKQLAGWARLKVSGPAGTKIVLRYSERLNADGSLKRKEKKKLHQTDTYILKGEGTEILEPRFVYHGFRYVEVTGFPGKATLGNLEGRFVHTAFARTGRFECSNEILNKIHRNTLRAYASNYHSIPTDNPEREKGGWTGEAQIVAEQAMFNFDNAAGYTKWLNDFKDEQRPNGALAAIIPTGGWGYNGWFGPGWDSAYVIIPWYLYQYYGDIRILESHYEGLKRCVDFQGTLAKGHIITIGNGDWAAVHKRTPVEVMSTAYYYADTAMFAEIARRLGRKEDTERYARQAEAIKKAFNDRYYDPATGLYSSGTQAALSAALFHRLVPADSKEWVLKNLVAAVEGNDGHLDTGILGSKYLLHVLTEEGQAEMAYGVVSETTYPGWGYWISQGATSHWEHWDGQKGTLNQIMFGDIDTWFFRGLAGINPDTNHPGFEHIIIRPNVVGDLSWVNGEFDSIRGRIASRWKVADGVFELSLEIPANSTATVYLPGSEASKVTEGRVRADRAEGVRFVGVDAGVMEFMIGSGRYAFEVE
ncbi:MAG: glycoside hydrolase family 78 protein [Planctomycetota bacterium]